MFEVIAAMILYVCGFPCLYGVVRLAVRHGLVDATRLVQEERFETTRMRTLMERVFTPGG